MSLSDEELFDALSEDDELLLQLALDHERGPTTSTAAVDAVPGQTGALISEEERNNEHESDEAPLDVPSPPADLVQGTNRAFAVEHSDREFHWSYSHTLFMLTDTKATSNKASFRHPPCR